MSESKSLYDMSRGELIEIVQNLGRRERMLVARLGGTVVLKHSDFVNAKDKILMAHEERTNLVLELLDESEVMA